MAIQNSDDMTLHTFYSKLTSDIEDRIKKINEPEQHKNIIVQTVREYVSLFFPAFKPIIRFYQTINDSITFSFCLVSKTCGRLKLVS